MTRKKDPKETVYNKKASKTGAVSKTERQIQHHISIYKTKLARQGKMPLTRLRCKAIQNLHRTAETAVKATASLKIQDDKKTSFSITEINDNGSVTECLPEGASNTLTISPKGVVLPSWHSVSSR